jgi:D-alanyl-D-alanine carboxypeptidase (penicillin-binding protein 5/6)
MKRFAVTMLVAAAATTAAMAQPSNFTAAIVIEPTTGRVLYEKNSQTPLPPASMTKMMTLLIVAENVRQGQLKYSDPVPVSARASKMGGSQVFLKQGEQFTVAEMAAATMIHSANDAAMSLAEKIGGSAESFVNLMNQRAQRLGLKNTKYVTPHGLPGEKGSPDDLMSAADLAKLGIELMKFPEMRQWAVTQQAPFRGGVFTMYNPNHLLKFYQGATGIKTGYHGKAGFCVTASAKRGDMELVSVVMGSDKKGSFENAAYLMTEAFNTWQLGNAVKKGQRVNGTVAVEDGAAPNVGVVAGGDARLLTRRGDAAAFQTQLSPAAVTAPVRQGQQVGWVVVKQGKQVVAKVPALAANAVEKEPWWKAFWPF